MQEPKPWSANRNSCRLGSSSGYFFSQGVAVLQKITLAPR